MTPKDSADEHPPFLNSSDTIALGPYQEMLDPGAVVLRGFIGEQATALLDTIRTIEDGSPFRHMITAGGFRMSAALTNCGSLGWVSDHHGYRYSSTDPLSGKPWPAMPTLFSHLACRAASAAGYAGFTPDACLINRYAPGARMTLHRDDSEHAFGAPIVSLSLGLSVSFQFGGLERSSPLRRPPLHHGDAVVWGGPARLRYHGVLPLKNGVHPVTGAFRINLTFRHAGIPDHHDGSRPIHP